SVWSMFLFFPFTFSSFFLPIYLSLCLRPARPNTYNYTTTSYHNIPMTYSYITPHGHTVMTENDKRSQGRVLGQPR
ncbi:MAG: hypothetical protein NXY57DRAFT_996601, partial [Lentinula lateritia]